MRKVKNGLQIIQTLISNNDFPNLGNGGHRPIVLVLRQTIVEENKFIFHQDNGKNCCDDILLYGADNKVYAVNGRSVPHDVYQKRMVEGSARANYIASGCYVRATRKGPHRGKEALVQNKAYLVWRSTDMILGNDDDYVDSDGFVADNIHGGAPYSAGCITIAGKMKLDQNGSEIRTGDWAFAHDWIYDINKAFTFFHVIVLNFADTLHVENPLRENWFLRPGSIGLRVMELQRKLGLKDDGDFGPMTFHSLRKMQEKLGVKDDGIYGPITRKNWEKVQ